MPTGALQLEQDSLQYWARLVNLRIRQLLELDGRHAFSLDSCFYVEVLSSFTILQGY